MIMNKSLQLTLCDTQGKLFELSGERGYDSESFIKSFMTTDISKDMDKDFHHVQWAGKEYIMSRMEDENPDAIDSNGIVFDNETLYNLARAIKFSVSGNASPHSHLETACLETLSCSARDSWERRACLRNA